MRSTMTTTGVAERLAPVGAGCVAGGASVLVGHPFDSVKTRLQVGKPLAVSGASLSGVRELYRGIAPPLLTAGLVQGVVFSAFEAARRRALDRARQDGPLSASSYLACVACAGSASGFAVAPITVPVGVIKVQQQVATKRGFVVCARDLVQRLGWRALYRGAVPGLVMEGCGRAVYMCTYEAVKLAQLEPAERHRVQQGERVPTSLRVKMTAAAVAGSAGWISVYAVDVTKSRMMLDVERLEFPTWRDCIRATWAEGGMARMYRGIGFSLIRASPVAATVLPIYEMSRDKLTELLARLDGLQPSQGATTQ